MTYAVHSYDDSLRQDGRNEVQAKWDKVEKVRADKLLEVTQKGITDTQALQAAAEEQRKASNDQITALNGNLRSALERLRDRPARPTAASGSSVPQAATAGTGCTGAGLYQEDGGFLTREAARAKRLQLDVEACQTQYNAAREALK